MVSGSATYAAFVQTNFWDKLTAGTYGESNNLDAAGFGAAVVSGRTSQGIVELSPWDLSSTANAAHLAGETTIRNAFMASIRDGLNATTTSDNDYDLHGLAGAIWASANTGYDLDPTSGRWASANSTGDLVTSLLSYQRASDGAWVWSTAADPSDVSNGDLQVTAFAILALKAWDSATYATEIANGVSFINGLQEGSGQFLVYPGASTTAAGGVEAHAEALYALSTGGGLIAVELISFAAQATGRGVTLTWSTATETENLGFHVYRSLQAEGEYNQITSAIIPGAGNSAEAHTYSYTDRNVEIGTTYYYKLADVDFNGNLRFHGPVSATVAVVPDKYALHQNYPNPFNPETAISYSLKSDGYVKLTIINNLGQTVRMLVNANQEAGNHSVLWNGRDDRGRLVASGVYLYRLEVNGFSEMKKLVFSK